MFRKSLIPAVTGCLVFGLTGLMLSGCAGVVLSGAAGTTAAVSQERKVEDNLADQRIGLAIRDKWLTELGRALPNIDITVNEAVVLLTGRVANPDDRVDAVRLAWQVKGVKRVLNEISLESKPGLGDLARDQKISLELRSKLTFDTSINAFNFSIDTVDGVVYFMGVAKTQAELDRALNTARSISGVVRVVNYARIAGP